MIKKLRDIEDAYMELLCQKTSAGNVDFFYNNILIEMYDLNFTLIKALSSEKKLKITITNYLDDIKKKRKKYLKLVFHPDIKLSQEFLKWATLAGFETSKINYMFKPLKVHTSLKENSDCVIKQVDSIDEIQRGLNCAMEINSKRMGPELAEKKLNQKREIYLKKSILYYICFVNGRPIGYCDWFHKDNIIKIEELVILNEYQGKGYGSLMIKKMILDAASRGYESLYVVTYADDEEHNLYSKLGFDFVGDETEMFFKEK